MGINLAIYEACGGSQMKFISKLACLLISVFTLNSIEIANAAAVAADQKCQCACTDGSHQYQEGPIDMPAKGGCAALNYGDCIADGSYISTPYRLRCTPYTPTPSWIEEFWKYLFGSAQ